MIRNIRLLISFLLLLVVSTPAEANIGVPMVFITVPMMIVGLLPIIAIEAYIYLKKLNLTWKPAIKLATISNLISTLLGIPLAWFFLVILQMITGGGGSNGLGTPLKNFLAVTWQAPWLIPYEKDMYWMVPSANIVLLFPFFFASFFIEYLTIKKLFQSDNTKVIKRAVFIANETTYLAMLFLSILWLHFSILNH